LLQHGYDWTQAAAVCNLPVMTSNEASIMHSNATSPNKNAAAAEAGQPPIRLWHHTTGVFNAQTEYTVQLSV